MCEETLLVSAGYGGVVRILFTIWKDRINAYVAVVFFHACLHCTGQYFQIHSTFSRILVRHKAAYRGVWGRPFELRLFWQTFWTVWIGGIGGMRKGRRQLRSKMREAHLWAIFVTSHAKKVIGIEIKGVSDSPIFLPVFWWFSCGRWRSFPLSIRIPAISWFWGVKCQRAASQIENSKTARMPQLHIFYLYRIVLYLDSFQQDFLWPKMILDLKFTIHVSSNRNSCCMLSVHVCRKAHCKTWRLVRMC